MSPRTTVAIRELRSAAIAVLGIILAAVPPALWLAWTQAGFLLVLAVGAICGLSIIILADLFPHDIDDEPSRRLGEGRAVFPDELVAELHGIFPLTYHHCRIEKARFRHTMVRLRRLLG